MNAKYIPSEKIDAIITDVYRSDMYGRKATRVASQRTGWPISIVKDRARKLGLCGRTPERTKWSDRELEVLERYAWMGLPRIQKKIKELCGTHRPLSGIGCKRVQLKLYKNLDGYSLVRLSQLIGANEDKIRRWIKWGWLKAEHRGMGYEWDHWYVAHKDVYRFAMEHYDEIDPRKAYWPWLADLMSDGKIGVGLGSTVKKESAAA